MDKTPGFTQEDLFLIYTACMSYGDKVSTIVESIPNERGTLLNELSDKAKASRKLARNPIYKLACLCRMV